MARRLVIPHDGRVFMNRTIGWIPIALMVACSPATSPSDAGLGIDAGSTTNDAGTTQDAGVADDAGLAEDAGADAGIDGGPIDAGDLWPTPSAYLPLHGPGGPTTTFDAGLGVTCAYLPGGPGDVDHHNIVHSFDGYLAMPWAPESGNGGLSFFDFSKPCVPRKVSEVTSADMRETHAMAFTFIGGKWFAATNSRTGPASGGVLLWDVTDPLHPVVASHIDVPGFTYPDGYARVVQSMAWQGSWLYLASGDLGVDVIDTSNPLRPRYVKRHAFAPTLRTFSIKAVGTLLFVHASESPRAEFLDISDPANPQPIPGGSFSIKDGPMGTAREAYGANLQNGYAYFARKDSGGGVIVYDVRQPGAPVFAGISQTGFGNGGYVFVTGNLAFVGESGGASIYDLSDLSMIRRLQSFSLRGDLDTITPYGNIAVLSVDADATPGQSTSVVPWAQKPDATPPQVTWAWPAANTIVPVTMRFGVTFSEFVEPRSVFEGSVRLFETATGARVNGLLSSQESVVTFTPVAPLKPHTRYTLWIPRGGVADWNQNPTSSDFTLTLETEP
jgi:hypothetical protein